MDHLNHRFFEFNTILKDIDKQYRMAANALGVSECVLWILYALRETNDKLTQKEVVDTLLIPPQTVNSALKKMEAAGYVELRNDTDRRSKQIYLTEKGIQLAQDTADRVIAMEMKALGELTEEEQSVFLKIFHKYQDALKKHLKNLGKENIGSE